MKVFATRKSLALIFLGSAFFLVFILYSNKIIVKDSSKSLTANIALLNAPLPARLRVPKIGVDAVIDSVGLTSFGEVGVPKGPESAAWFNLGPRPGDIGSAIIDGHSGYKGNKPAIFDNLYKLRKGDKIYVEDEKGTVIAFVVREIRSYDRNAQASDVFSLNDQKAHLNLITCSGDWNKKDKTHSSRLVVFTDKI